MVWFECSKLMLRLFFFFTVLLGTMSLVTFLGAFYWLTDPRTSIVPLVDSLWNHPVFTFSTAILCKFCLYFGRRVVDG